MIRSMTGYGRGRAQVGEIAFSVEVKAVNHRYGDVNIKAPRLLLPYEGEIKKQVSATLKRGKIDIFINQEPTDAAVTIPVLNRPVAQAYIQAFKEMQQEFNLTNGASLELLVAQKDVLVLQENCFDEIQLKQCLAQALDDALKALVVMRDREGEATRIDISERLGLMAQLLGQIEERAPQVPLEWQIKLQERLARYGDDAADPQRIAQEIALFADRCDISEEVVRFKSHLEQFADLLDVEEPVGRQLDFLIQELNRETNTMGSKSNDADLTRQVVTIKAELEKIREQVQNIE
ncbi:MAG TPA: YicC/YloC family endoribonuclease [Geopsychrobacteraceae bacterium]|nr:YicC/YloC family endoribonuclease [Geopsychrobacteraceae bacterium]